MPASMPASVRARIRAHIIQNDKTSVIHKATGISIGAINKMKRLFLETGDVVPRNRLSSGRPRSLSEGHVEKLKEYLSEHPEANQSDIVWWIFDEFGIVVDQSTVSRVVGRWEWRGGRRRRKGLKVVERGGREEGG